MYTDEEILYHAFKISQTRDDQLMHAGWTKKIANGIRIPSKDVRKEAITEIKDKSDYEKAYSDENRKAIDKFVDKRVEYYARHLPPQINGYIKSYVTGPDADNNVVNVNNVVSRGLSKWMVDTAVKIQDETHRQFGSPRNPYTVEYINMYWDTDSITSALDNKLVDIYR